MDINYLNETGSNCKIKFEKEFVEELTLIKANMDSQIKLFVLYCATITYDPYTEQDKHTSMALTAIYKNLISLYSTLDLTAKGLYGSARIIFRNVFEYLVISKTVAIKNDSLLLEKWENGENISLRKDIFNNVITPNSDAMKDYWKCLCEFTHGTIYSQQIELRYDKIKHELKFNLVCIKMLLDMNYHVLNTYVANRSIQYYTQFMVDIENQGEYKSKKQEIRKQILSMRKSLLKEPKTTVTDFCKKWVFKN